LLLKKMPPFNGFTCWPLPAGFPLPKSWGDFAARRACAASGKSLSRFKMSKVLFSCNLILQTQSPAFF